MVCFGTLSFLLNTKIKMDYKNFKSLIDILIEQSKKSSKAHDLGLDLYDYIDSYHRGYKILIREVLNDYGVDWFEWYLYEKKGITGKPDKEMKAWDKDKKEICYDVRSLYNYLKENKYFKNQNGKDI